MKISPSLLFSEINEVRLPFQFKTLVLPMRNLVYHFILHTRVAVCPSVSPPDSVLRQRLRGLPAERPLRSVRPSSRQGHGARGGGGGGACVRTVGSPSARDGAAVLASHWSTSSHPPAEPPLSKTSTRHLPKASWLLAACLRT